MKLILFIKLSYSSPPRPCQPPNPSINPSVREYTPQQIRRQNNEEHHRNHYRVSNPRVLQCLKLEGERAASGSYFSNSYSDAVPSIGNIRLQQRLEREMMMRNNDIDESDSDTDESLNEQDLPVQPQPNLNHNLIPFPSRSPSPPIPIQHRLPSPNNRPIIPPAPPLPPYYYDNLIRELNPDIEELGEVLRIRNLNGQANNRRNLNSRNH